MKEDQHEKNLLASWERKKMFNIAGWPKNFSYLSADVVCVEAESEMSPDERDLSYIWATPSYLYIVIEDDCYESNS